jgi:integrase
VENTLEQDLFEMNLTNLGKAIENTMPMTKNVARSTGRFISSYISWAIENGLRSSNINPLKSVDAEWYDKFVGKNKIHYSYDEFFQLLEELQNGQDQAFLALIWSGAMGEGFGELRELKFEDVNWDNNTVYLKDREYHVSVCEKTMSYLDKAYKQITYYQYNMKTKEFTEKELIPSDFVFKNVRSPRVQDAQPVGINVFYNRLHAIRDYLELDLITPNAIRQSGMIYSILKEAEKNNMIIKYDQFAVVGEKYNFSKITNEQYEYYNTNLMKDYISIENIKELYGVDVEITKK